MNRKLISSSVAALLILPGAGLYAVEAGQGNEASAPSQFTPLQKRPEAPVKGMPAKPAEIRMLPHTDTRPGAPGQPLITVPAPPPPAAKPGAEGARSFGPASKVKAPHYREGEVVVVFKKGAGLPKVGQSLATSNLTLAKRFDKLSAKIGKTFALVRGGKGMKAHDLLTLMKRNPLVETVSLNYGKRTNQRGGCPGASPNDSFFDSYQWPLCNYGQTGGTPDADIDATEAWTSYTGSTDVIMAVLDTGVDYNHPDLHANMWVNPPEASGIPGVDDDNNGYVDDIYGIDTGEHDSDPMDIFGHGTHVAGILGAVGNNGEGVAGINWTARIMAVKGFYTDGYMYEDAELEALGYILAMKEAGHNVVAVNASYGCYNCYSDPERLAIQSLGNAGILFVAAAGNESVNNDVDPNYPSSYDLPNIISVAATDHNDVLSQFSNYGVTSVDLAAPGQDVLSTYWETLYTPGAGGDSFFDNMESGSGNWTADPPWAITEEQSWSLTHAWSDSPGGNYADNQFNMLLSKSIDLSGVTGPLSLGFYARFELEEFWDSLDIYYLNEPPGWALTQEQSHSSSHAWSDSPDGNYLDNSINTLESPAMDLSSTPSGSTVVTFWFKGETEEELDNLNLYCQGGGVWYYLGYITGSVPDWTWYGAYVPDECRTADAKFSFDLVTDVSITYDGYYIDDVAVSDGTNTYFADDMESGENGWTHRASLQYYYQSSISGSSGGNWRLFNVPIDPEFRSDRFHVAFILNSNDSITFDGVYLDDVGIGRAAEDIHTYAWASGTSMAAPHVTGAVGFLAGLYHETADQIKDRILKTVDFKGLRVLTGGRLSLSNAPPPPRPCDVDADGDIDRNDLSLISRARGQPPVPNDPRDANGDGKINPADVQACIPQCTRPNCATQ